MNKYKIMEEIEKLTLIEQSDLSHWLMDLVMDKLENNVMQSIRRIGT